MNLQSVKESPNWSPKSWRAMHAKQLPVYEDALALDAALAQVAALPPLVTSWEVIKLRQEMALAAEGRCFVLQGGDCAESFQDCNSGTIANRLKILLQMSLVLVHGLKLPVVRIGRFAGQYAKPRSADLETRDGVTLPSYRGDIVNRPEFSAQARRADPQRLIDAHTHSAMTMNFVRALIDGGFADLHHPEYWDLDWVQHSPLKSEYRRMVESIGDSVRFMETLAGGPIGDFSSVDFFTSHEALHLPYEEACTRQVPRQWGWFNLATHFPWVGMRTAGGDSAHIEYARGLRNPMGLKVGPSATPSDLIATIKLLNPNNEPGRLSLIHRMGSAHIAGHLPRLLEAVDRADANVVWICDPMHGNTESTSNGYKTRRFENIRSELEQAFDLHRDVGTRLGGVHLELTGENVTECLGGARELKESDLARCYQSQVDPRLNYEQALELAMLIVRKRGVLS